MKLEIFNEPQPEPEEVVRLSLIRSTLDPKIIQVVALTSYGGRVYNGTICSISERGLRRNGCLNPQLGFKMTGTQIKETNQ